MQYKKGQTPWNKGLAKELQPMYGKTRGSVYGESNPFYGKKHSPETIEKLRLSKLGKKRGAYSPEHRAKISSSLKGIKRPLKEKHWNWKGGVTPEDRLQRAKFQKSVQKEVFKRDDYTCQMCGNKGGQLQVDHIQPWAEYVELRFDITNCRTLCMDCHYLITFGKPKPAHITAWGHNLKMLREESPFH